MRPPTPRGSATSPPMRTRTHRRAPGHDAREGGLYIDGHGVTERHCCTAVLRSPPPVQVGGQPHSLKAFSRQEAARKGLSKFL